MLYIHDLPITPININVSETTTLAGAPAADAATGAPNAPSVPDAANSTSQEEPSQAPVAEQPTQEPQVAASFGGDGADAEAPEEIEIEYRPIVDFDADIDLSEQYAASMVPVVEGQMVSGQVIRVDDDEVLLDIGFKSEGVIPARELSIRRDVTTHELVKVGEQLEAAVLHREDREGRLILSKKRGAVRTGLGTPSLGSRIPTALSRAWSSKRSRAG